ncbi:MAG: hypothetical protein QMC67_10830 [Candidatus Wallbacteria bacterium]
MSMFSLLKQTGSEQVKFCAEKKSNFKAIIALNSTALGPALGDITFIPDSSNYQEATSCACFLAQKLTNIYGFLGINYGGGKVIALGKPTPGYEEIYFRSLARHVNNLNGRFIVRSSSYVNTRLLDHIKAETNKILPQSVIVNDDLLLPEIKKIAFLNSLKEISTKVLNNKPLSELKISLCGTNEDFKRYEWLLKEIPTIRTFSDPLILSDADSTMDILLICPTNANNSVTRTLFKLNFKAAMGLCEEEIDIEIMEDVMLAKGICYVPGYLVENLECFYFMQNNIEALCKAKPDFGPFEMFVRERLAWLFDEAAKTKQKITRIIDNYAKSRMEMLQLLK